jgi:hypothetical protein
MGAWVASLSTSMHGAVCWGNGRFVPFVINWFHFEKSVAKSDLHVVFLFSVRSGWGHSFLYTNGYNQPAHPGPSMAPFSKCNLFLFPGLSENTANQGI